MTAGYKQCNFVDLIVAGRQEWNDAYHCTSLNVAMHQNTGNVDLIHLETKVSVSVAFARIWHGATWRKILSLDAFNNSIDRRQFSPKIK